MSDHDVQLLAIGAALGMYFMLFIQMVFGLLDDRRDRKAERDAMAMLEAARKRAEA